MCLDSNHDDIAVPLLEQLDAAAQDPGFALLMETPDAKIVIEGTLKFRGFEGDIQGHPQQAVSDLRRALAMEKPTDPQAVYVALGIWLAEVHASQATADKHLRRFTKLRGGMPPPDWPGALIKFYLNQMQESDLFNAAKSTDKETQINNLCEGWYYAGRKRLLAKDEITPIDYFQKCIATGRSDFYEYKMSQIELKQLLPKG